MDKYKINISGKNVKYILDRLINLKIDLLNIDYIDHNNLNIIIYSKDYDKLKKMSTTYKIKIINKYGLTHIKEVLKLNRLLLILLCISIIILIILSNIIFKIQVIHEDINIRNIIYKELNNYNIKKYKFKKNNKLKEIKNNILNKYKNDIEWLEIESIGTSYIIRVKERKIENKKDNNYIRNIVSLKNAIIRSIDLKKGVIVRDRGSYVKKGEIIISNEVKLNDNVITNIETEGVIYGEVWYKAIIEYPYHIKEVISKKKVKGLVFKFFNKEKVLLKKIKKYKVLDNSILPISFKIQDIEIQTTREEVLTCSTASIKAIEYLKNKIDNIEKIKILNTVCHYDKVSLEIFYTTIENITDYN